jgi:hypothetical protein
MLQTRHSLSSIKHGHLIRVQFWAQDAGSGRKLELRPLVRWFCALGKFGIHCSIELLDAKTREPVIVALVWSTLYLRGATSGQRSLHSGCSGAFGEHQPA